MYHSLLLEALLDLLNLSLRRIRTIAPGPDRDSAIGGLAHALGAGGLDPPRRSHRALRRFGLRYRLPSPPGSSIMPLVWGSASSPRRQRADSCHRPAICGSAASTSAWWPRWRGRLRRISPATRTATRSPSSSRWGACVSSAIRGSTSTCPDCGGIAPGPPLRMRRSRSMEREQAETWSAHRIGGRPVVELTEWNGEDRFEATCRGWSRPGTRHRRSVNVEPDRVTVVDRIEGPCRGLRVCWPLAPGLAGGARAGSESRKSES